MQYVIQKTGYKILAHHPFREDITDRVDGDEVVAKVKRDPRRIAEKYGMITAYAQTQAEGEEQLREAAEGKGAAVAVVGPEQVRGLLRDVEPGYVRACEVMRMQFVV